MCVPGSAGMVCADLSLNDPCGEWIARCCGVWLGLFALTVCQLVVFGVLADGCP